MRGRYAGPVQCGSVDRKSENPVNTIQSGSAFRSKDAEVGPVHDLRSARDREYCRRDQKPGQRILIQDLPTELGAEVVEPQGQPRRHATALVRERDEVVLQIPDQDGRGDDRSDYHRTVQNRLPQPASIVDQHVENHAESEEDALVLGEDCQPDRAPGQERESLLPPADGLGWKCLQQKPQRQKPEHHQRRVRQDDDTSQHRAVHGRRMENGGEQPRSLAADPAAHEIHQPCGDRRAHHGRQPDEHLGVEGQVQREPLNQPADHRRMVEVAPVREGGVGPVVDLVVAKLGSERKPQPHQRRDHDQPDDGPACVGVGPAR